MWRNHINLDVFYDRWRFLECNNFFILKSKIMIIVISSNKKVQQKV
jgi:hypothetical protein